MILKIIGKKVEECVTNDATIDDRPVCLSICLSLCFLFEICPKVNRLSKAKFPYLIRFATITKKDVVYLARIAGTIIPMSNSLCKLT